MYLMNMFSDDPGNETVCDKCPASCSRVNYGVLLSYASISPLSVDTLLADHREAITNHYKTARDLRERLQVQ